MNSHEASKGAVMLDEWISYRADDSGIGFWPSLVQEVFQEQRVRRAVWSDFAAHAMISRDGDSGSQLLQPAEPSEEECRRYYDRNIDRFRTPDLFEAAHILIEPEGKDDAAWAVAFDATDTQGVEPQGPDLGYHGSAAVVLLSDGENTDGPDPLDLAEIASSAGVRVYPIGLGRPEGTVLEIDGFQIATALDEPLRRAGIATADGFALNVSNFETTEASTDFGKRLSARVGGKPFVIDTSRNGGGPLTGGRAEAWCNPPGRALGTPPTTDTRDDRLDAYLWIKRPGESDGTCRGGPEAGTWWPEYALGLARRAKS